MEKRLTGPGLATGADTEMLLDVWSRSFGDPAPYIRNFLNVLSEPENTVVWREDGRVVSAAYLLPATLRIDQTQYRAYCVTRAATHPDYRRKGFMEQVLRQCRTLCEERGIDFLVLSPGTNELYKYFSRFGYRANFYAKTTVMDREQLAALADRLDPPEERAENTLSAGVPADLPEIRAAALSEGAHLDYDAKTLQYLLFEHVYSGGRTLLLPDGYALYRLSDEDSGEKTLTVRELCSRGTAGTLLRQLLETDADRFVLNLPAFDGIRGGRTSSGRAGMDLAVSPEAAKAERAMKNAYFGLTLD